jgi:hypothetical protein
MSSKLTQVLTAAVLLLYFTCPAELAAQDIVRLSQECGQGREKSCQELVKIATTAKDSTLRVSAIRGISDQSALSRIANTDPSASVRRSAVVRLSDQNTIRSVATTDRDSDVRSEAVSRLQDPPALAQIARTDTSAMVRLAAIDRIQDQSVLKEISSSDPDISIRRAASKKVSEPGTKAQIAEGGRDGAGDSRRQKLTVDDVIELKRVGAANDLIIGQIKKSAPGYDISKNDLVRLFDAGVSIEIIRAMVQWSEEPRETSDTANGDAQPGTWPLDFGENPRIVYLPAISYGPNHWSVVKIANSGTDRAPMRFEVYRADGSTHPASAEFLSEPQGEQEIRVEGAQVGFTEPFTYAWVRVTYPEQAQGIKITTSMDRIDEEDKNLLHSVARDPEVLADPPRTIWVYKTDGLQGKSLYFLNVGDEEATVRLCQGNTGALCPSSTVQMHLEGRTSLLRSTLLGLTSAFLIIQTEQQSKLVVMLLTPSAGELKQFKTNSTINFDAPDQ